MKTIDEIKAEIGQYFSENENVFTECIEELDSYNGYLGDDRYYPIDELDEILCGKDPIDLLNMAYFGHDEDNYMTDASGHREYGAFNPTSNYFRFNGYGNLVSKNSRDYSDRLDNYFVESLHDSRQWLYAIDNDETLTTLFDEWDEIEAQEA